MSKVDLRTVDFMQAVMMVVRLIDQGIEKNKAIELVSNTYLVSEEELKKHLKFYEKKAA